MPSGFVFSKLVPVPLEHRGGSDWPRVVAFSNLNYAGTRVKEVLEHIGDVLGANFCQDDVKKCSKSLKIARNRSNFVAC